MSRILYRSSVLGVAVMLWLSGAAVGAVEIAGLTHADGTAVEADEVSGDSLFIVFSTWSPKCRNIVERVNAIYGEWDGKTRIFLVNFQEDVAAVEKFLAGKSLEVEVLFDREASFSKKHKITYLPSLLAVKDGSAAFRGKLPADTTAVLRPIYE